MKTMSLSPSRGVALLMVVIALHAAYCVAVSTIQVVATTQYSTRGSSTPLVWTFTRSDTSTLKSISFSAGGTAGATDVSTSSFTVAVGGTVAFAVGQATATIQALPQVTGVPNQAPVTIVITITDLTYTVVGGPATGYVLDNLNVVNNMLVGVAPASVTVNSLVPLVFTVYRSGASTLPYSVPIVFSGTGVLGTDYTLSSPYTVSLMGSTLTVEVPAGQTSVAVTATPTYSGTATGTNTIIATLSASSAYSTAIDSAVTGTIMYDNPFVTLQAPVPSSVQENAGTPLVFTVVRTGSTAGTLAVPFVMSGNALTEFTVLTDVTVSYTPATSSGVVTIQAGAASGLVRIYPINDMVLTSATKLVTMTLQAPTGGSYSATPQTGLIFDDEANTFSLTSLNPTSISQNDTMTVFTVQVSRSGAPATLAASATVTLSVSGTAIFGSDFSASGTAVSFMSTSAVVTFAAGVSVASFTMAPINSPIIAPDKTIVLSIANGNYLMTGVTNVTATIVNVNGNSINLAVTPVSGVNIGDSTALVFIFTRRTLNSAQFTAQFSVAGSAVFGTDYTQVGASSFTTTTGSITFAAGSLQAALSLTPTLSTIPGQDKTIVISLLTGSGYAVLQPSSATGTIINNIPSAVSITVSPAYTPDDGSTGMTYTFTRNGRSNNALVVTFGVSGTASFTNPDYTVFSVSPFTFTSASGTITIPAASLSASLVVTSTPNSAAAGDRTVILTVAAGTSYAPAAGASSATGTLFSHSGPDVVSVTSSPSAQAESVASPFTFVFRRSGSPASAITVSFAVTLTNATLADFTQLGAATFTATAGTITIPANAYSASVQVTAHPFDTPSANKVITVAVQDGGAAYSVIAGPTASASITILNDNPKVSLSIVGLTTLSQSIGGTFVFQFFRPLGAISGNLVVQYTVGGTAVPGVDYTANTGSMFPGSLGATGQITIPDQSQVAVVQLSPVDFHGPQPDKTISLTLAAPSTPGSYYIVTPGAVVATITNPYPTQVTVSVSPTSVAPGGQSTFTFTRLGSTTSSLTVSFSFSGSAPYGTSYTQSGAATFSTATLSGTVTIPAGTTSVPLTVTAANPMTVQPAQTAILTLQTGTGYAVSGNSTAVLTILGNAITVSLAVTPTTPVNTPNSVSFTFTRTGGAGTDVSVSFTLSGSATLNQQFTLVGAFSGSVSPFSVFMPSGTTTVTLTATPISGVTLGFTRSIVITLGTSAAYNIGSPSSVTGFIQDPPVLLPSVTLTTNVQALLDSVTTGVSFTFRIPNALTSDLVVSFNAYGNATLNLDYQVTNSLANVVWNPNPNKATISTVVISAGSISTTINIVPLHPISAPLLTVGATVIGPASGMTYTVGTPSSQLVTLIRDASAPSTSSPSAFTGNVYSIRIINVGLKSEPSDGPHVFGKRQVEFAAVSSGALITSAASFLTISTQYLQIPENFGNQIILQFGTIPNGASNAVLAMNFVLAINSRVPGLSQTPYAFATAYTIGTLPSVTLLTAAQPPVIIPPINQYFNVYVNDNRPMRVGVASTLQASMISLCISIILALVIALVMA